MGKEVMLLSGTLPVSIVHSISSKMEVYHTMNRLVNKIEGDGHDGHDG
jgi:hypothetical protein